MTTLGIKEAWEGFVKGNNCDEIDVRDFIQLNYTPCKGRCLVPGGSTEPAGLGTHEENCTFPKSARCASSTLTPIPRRHRRLQARLHCEDDNVIVGLQTGARSSACDAERRLALVGTAIPRAGKGMQPRVRSSPSTMRDPGDGLR